MVDKRNQRRNNGEEKRIKWQKYLETKTEKLCQEYRCIKIRRPIC